LDTKSKKLSNRFAARLVAFILVVALTAGAAAFVLIGDGKVERLRENMRNYPRDIIPISDILSGKSLMESDYFMNRFNSDILGLVKLYRNYGGFNPTNPAYDAKSDPVIMEAYDSEEREIYSDIKRVINNYLFDGQMNNGLREPDEYLETTDEELGLELTGYPDRIVFDYKQVLFDLSESPLINKKGGISEYTDGVRLDWIAADYGDPGVKEAFEKIYASELAQVLQYIVLDATNEYKNNVEYLEDSGASYYIGNGKTFITNVQLNKENYPADTKVFTSSPAYLQFENGNFTIKPERLQEIAGNSNGETVSEYELISDLKASEDVSAFFAYDKNLLASQASAMTQMQDIIRTYGALALIAFVLSLIIFIMLLVRTGGKREDGTRKLYALDKVFVEVQLAIIAFAVAIPGIYLVDGDFMWYARVFIDIDWTNQYEVLIGLACVVGVVLGITLVLWCVLSIVRNIKAGLFAKRSIICIIIRFIYGALKSLFLIIKSGFDGTNPFAKTILLVALLLFVSAISGGIFVSFIPSYRYGYVTGGPVVFVLLILLGIATLAFVFTAQRIKKYGKLKQGVEEIARGNLMWRVYVDENDHSEFANLSRRVNEIGSATNIAVQNELKNQRLKTDLITNVSHDLKTPLTSIITYTDLLKKEGLRGKNAPEYLNIIDEKGRRLQKLTEDLFDAAKASSGAVQVQREKLDLLSLLNQEIAEMANGLAVAELDVIVNGRSCGSDETSADGDVASHFYVLADSRLLWRVVDNLLANVRKYALPGSRVYIDVRDQKPGEGAADGRRGMTVMEMKNISNVKLNIPADELMERFKRGDESRTTEGSGLGLAIAKDLVRLQGGMFEISIDGDLFKTVTMLEPYEE
jgi:signal transduction histidine kinase